MNDAQDNLSLIQLITVSIVGLICFALMLPVVIGRIAGDMANNEDME